LLLLYKKKINYEKDNLLQGRLYEIKNEPINRQLYDANDIDDDNDNDNDIKIVYKKKGDNSSISNDYFINKNTNIDNHIEYSNNTKIENNGNIQNNYINNNNIKIDSDNSKFILNNLKNNKKD